MAIDGFDYKAFSESMVEQARTLIPSDIDDDSAEYIVSTMGNFTYLAGEALYNDEDRLEFNAEQATFVVQIIAEWTFHKTVDLARSDIPKEYWDSIMQKIAFTAYEISKQTMLKNIPLEELLSIIENNIKKCWVECLDNLADKNIIDKTTAESSKSLSNIDKMAKESKENGCDCFCNKDKKNTIKISDENNYCSCNDIPQCKASQFCLDIFIPVMLVLPIIIGIFCIVYGLYLFFNPFTSFCRKYILTIPFIQHHPVYVLMCIFSIIGIIGIILLKKEVNKDVERQLKELENVKKNMQDLVNPNKMYARLGVDILSLQVGSGLLEIADPDQEGQLLAKIAAMRQELTDELGYIIPNIRIMDTISIEPCEYLINIRNNLAESGYVYPGKYMVIADQWDSCCPEIPDDAIVGVDPTYQSQAYWVSEKDAGENKNIAAVSAADVIVTHLKEVLIKYVDEVMTKTDVLKLMELVRSQDPTLVNDLVPAIISTSDLRKIFVHLIREKVSIKDIIFIFERLGDYARFSKEPDILTERIRAALGRQICLSNADEFHVLYSVTLSPYWEKILDENCQRTELGTMFRLEPEQVRELVELTSMTLMKAHHLCGQQPVVLCSPRIRLPLYQLLERHIPTIVVISYSELIPSVKVEAVLTIGEES